jgi:hypothetical protein
MVSMVIILLIVPMSIGKKMMTRRRRKATRKISIIRIKPMVRRTLARSGTLVMRALTPIVMVSPPYQSRATPLPQASLSSPTSVKGSILTSWQRRVRKMSNINPLLLNMFLVMMN